MLSQSSVCIGSKVKVNNNIDLQSVFEVIRKMTLTLLLVVSLWDLLKESSCVIIFMAPITFSFCDSLLPYHTLFLFHARVLSKTLCILKSFLIDKALKTITCDLQRSIRSCEKENIF